MGDGRLTEEETSQHNTLRIHIIQSVLQKRKLAFRNFNKNHSEHLNAAGTNLGMESYCCNEVDMLKTTETLAS